MFSGLPCGCCALRSAHVLHVRSGSGGFTLHICISYKRALCNYEEVTSRGLKLRSLGGDSTHLNSQVGTKQFIL